MEVDALEVKMDKKQAMKIINNKIPLMSKVVQLNKRIKNIKLQYIEYKVITYEIIHKLNLKERIFNKSNTKVDNITMLINTSTGYSFNTNNIPNTVKINIEKTNLRESSINESQIINSIKDELIKNLHKKIDCVQNINLVDIKSIYIPFWVGFYDDKNIFIEAD
jgi:hypothetical protein